MQDQVTEKADLDEALKLARADIRDLQRTVSALRDALEAAHAEAQAGVARANAGNAGNATRSPAAVKSSAEPMRRSQSSVRADFSHIAPKRNPHPEARPDGEPR